MWLLGLAFPLSQAARRSPGDRTDSAGPARRAGQGWPRAWLCAPTLHPEITDRAQGCPEKGCLPHTPRPASRQSPGDAGECSGIVQVTGGRSPRSGCHSPQSSSTFTQTHRARRNAEAVLSNSSTSISVSTEAQEGPRSSHGPGWPPRLTGERGTLGESVGMPLPGPQKRVWASPDRSSNTGAGEAPMNCK